MSSSKKELESYKKELTSKIDIAINKLSEDTSSIKNCLDMFRKDVNRESTKTLTKFRKKTEYLLNLTGENYEKNGTPKEKEVWGEFKKDYLNIPKEVKKEEPKDKVFSGEAFGYKDESDEDSSELVEEFVGRKLDGEHNKKEDTSSKEKETILHPLAYEGFGNYSEGEYSSGSTEEHETKSKEQPKEKDIGSEWFDTKEGVNLDIEKSSGNYMLDNLNRAIEEARKRLTKKQNRSYVPGKIKGEIGIKIFQLQNAHDYAKEYLKANKTKFETQELGAVDLFTIKDGQKPSIMEAAGDPRHRSIFSRNTSETTTSAMIKKLLGISETELSDYLKSKKINNTTSKPS